MNTSRAHAMHANPFPWSFPMMHPDWHMLVCHQLPADQGVHAILPIYKMWMRYIHTTSDDNGEASGSIVHNDGRCHMQHGLEVTIADI